MARIRTIKPDFWTDEKIGTSLKRDERLLFIGLWNLADDQGVLKSSAAYIKGQLFSYDEELRTTTVTSWLTSLEKALMIVPFILNGESYYIIRTFQDHQLINRPSKPKFDQTLIDNILHEYSLNTHGILTEYSLLEWKGNRGEIEGKGEGPQSKIDIEKICLEQSTQWHESMMKKFNIKSHDEMKGLVNEFFLTLKAADETKTDLADAKSHCSRWINKHLEKINIKGAGPVGAKSKLEKLKETFENTPNPYENGNPVVQ